jgi:hypothetical protein
MSTKRFAVTLALVPLLASCVNPMYSAEDRAQTAEYLRKVRDPATYYAMDCETFLATKKAYDQYPSSATIPIIQVIAQVAAQRDCTPGSSPAPSAAIASHSTVAPKVAPAPVPLAAAPMATETGRLGVHVTAVTSTVVKQFGLPAISGVLVLGPVPGSGAEKAGMLAGDIILEVAGTTVNTPAELMAVVSRIRPGFTAPLRIWRYRATLDVLVEISGSMDTEPSLALEFPRAVAGSS